MLRLVTIPHDLPQLLVEFEAVREHFSNDFLPTPQADYPAWVCYIVSIIRDAGEWFFVREATYPQPSIQPPTLALPLMWRGHFSVEDGYLSVITGAVWAHNWTYYYNTPYACEISGFSARGVSVWDNLKSLQEFLRILFFSSPVYIVRAVLDERNIVARRMLKRAGFSHVEVQRAAYLRNNCEHTVIIMSMTRREFEINCLSREGGNPSII